MVRVVTNIDVRRRPEKRRIDGTEVDMRIDRVIGQDLEDGVQ